MTTNQDDPKVWKIKIFSATALKIALILVAVFWLVVVAASWAESAEPELETDHVSSKTQRAPASDVIQDDSEGEYNFNWLDPEKKIYVLQNRRYLKANHVFLNLMVGPGLSSPYRSTFNVDPRIDYYFSEAFGIEAMYNFGFNTPNDTFQALTQQDAGLTVPVTREITHELALMAQWVPWYAKINVFNQIIYFDWYFAGGAGEVASNLITQSNVTAAASSTSQNFFSLYLGTGHLYHISDDVTVRIDFTGAYYKAPLQGNAGDSTWFSNYNLSIGFGYRL